MAELEGSLESFFLKRVRLVGGYAIKIVPIEAGAPDRLVLLPGGHMYLVELKTETGSLEPIQKHWHAKVMRNQGIRVHVVTGREGIVRWLSAVIQSSTASPRRKSSPPAKTA